MRHVVILLLEGFLDDEVVVSVDGAEMARRPGASTSALLGVAEEVRLELPETAERLAIDLPGRGLEADVPLPEGDTTMLVDVAVGAVTVRPASGHEGLL